MKIGIRKETLYPTEKRAALTPDHVKTLTKHNFTVFVESAEQRAFSDFEYQKAGAIITDNLENSDFIFGVKEVPINDLIPNKPYCFFSHTIKGQKYNMPMLKKILDLNITLFDYELVKNEKGIRIIFFGRYAGYAGMIDSLWLFGKRLAIEGIDTPFKEIKQALDYHSLDEAKNSIKKLGKEIIEKGLPNQIVPLITGFAGYGNVSKGAQEIYDLLPVIEIKASELETFISKGDFSKKHVYKVEFREEDMYEHPTLMDFNFDYFVKHPKEYSSIMYKYIPNLSMLINGIYWEDKFPKHVTKNYMKELYEKSNNRKLKVIGDISCDIEGSVELTTKATKSSNPAFVYDPLTNEVKDGVEGNGPVILAVTNLPAELPKESSKVFGDALLPFVENLVNADYSKDYNDLALSREFKEAIIAHKGKLTPNYQYLEKYLK